MFSRAAWANLSACTAYNAHAHICREKDMAYGMGSKVERVIQAEPWLLRYGIYRLYNGLRASDPFLVRTSSLNPGSIS